VLGDLPARLSALARLSVVLLGIYGFLLGRALNSATVLEILHGALVLLGGRAGFECAQVAPPSRARIDLARIETVLT
jgi:hypothetical protein